MATAERVAYIDGKIVPESEALISFRDSGFIRGTSVYDTSRTFNGKVFRLREHLERLWRSLAYLRIEPPISLPELEEISLEVARRNYAILQTDLWVTQRVSAGVPVQHGGNGRPTLIVECLPLPFAARAAYYRDGVRLGTSTIRRTPPWALSPQAKTNNLLNIDLASLEVHALDPDVWPILTDENGNLAEGPGSNVFVVRQGKILTPQARYVLPGIARQTALDLAHDLAIPVEECDIDLFQAYTADEMFITSTSFCICPVSSLNGIPVRIREIPGPVTRRLQDALSQMVGMDFVAQYLEHLPVPAAGK